MPSWTSTCPTSAASTSSAPFARRGWPPGCCSSPASLNATVSYELVEAGAAGVLDKSALPDEIGDALLRIAQGETVLAPDVQSALMQAVRDRRERPPTVLSPREAEVLRFLAAGLSAPQIARELHLSPSTVKTHLQRLYERLEVSDRAAAVAEGMRRGLIE